MNKRDDEFVEAAGVHLLTLVTSQAQLFRFVTAGPITVGRDEFIGEQRLDELRVPAMKCRIPLPFQLDEDLLVGLDVLGAGSCTRGEERSHQTENAKEEHLRPSWR